METHTDLPKCFKCEICEKSFTKLHNLKQHRETHEVRQNFICTECKKCYKSNSKLQFHIQSVHQNAFIHVCDICAKVFRGKATYEQHFITAHSDQKLPAVQCQICDSWLKNKFSLKSHMKRHKEESMTHICNICGKKAPNRDALRSHIKYLHVREKSHKCAVCDKLFKRDHDLKKHMAIHSGESLYKCTYCPKTFNSSSNMHAHRKKQHPKEWEEAKLKKFQII